jgi:hypothetical protein
MGWRKQILYSKPILEENFNRLRKAEILIYEKNTIRTKLKVQWFVLLGDG